MKELLKLTETFQVSRPVFKLTLEREDSKISANEDEPVYQYKPTPIEGNILSEMVCNEYRESFDCEKGTFIADKQRIAQEVMSDIRRSMGSFLERNLGMKNPRQSKIHRWYSRELPNDDEFNDMLVMLYKYMRTFCADERMIADVQEHRDNTIALLEAIMGKFNEE